MQQTTHHLRAAWLKDPVFDLSFLFGITLLAAAMSAATVIAPSLFVPMVTAHIWLFGFDHILATFTKLAGRPSDRAQNRFLLLYLPPLVLLVIFAVGTRFGLGALNTIYFFGQLFHTTRQSWGLAQQYRHKAGGLGWDPAWLSELTLWSVPIWGLLHRCYQHPTEFLYQELWLPRVPLWLVNVAGVFAIALLVWWVITRVVAFRRGELAVGHTLFLMTHFIVFFTSYLAIDDVNSGWLLVNVWHNVQYLAFVWMHNRQRFAHGIATDARFLSWLCQPGYRRAATYYLTCLVIGCAFYYTLFQVGDRLDVWLQGRVLSITLVASLTLNFHHYLVDGIIWKRRRNQMIRS